MKSAFLPITILGSCVLTACGGAVSGTGSSSENLVGTWIVESSTVTLDGAVLDPSCTTSIAIDSSVTASGSYTFHADDTFDAIHGTAGNVTALRSGDCLNGVQSCGELAANLTGTNMSASCTPPMASDNCTCTFNLTGHQSVTSGTYSTASRQLTVTVLGQTQQVDYVVSGATLTMTSQTIGALMIKGTMKLTKQ